LNIHIGHYGAADEFVAIDVETTFIAAFDEGEVHVINEYDGDREGIID